MHKRWPLVAAATVLVCSVLGCSDDAGSEAEDYLDTAMEEQYVGGNVYLTSRDAPSSSLTFTPDGVNQKLAIVATCFATDRDDTLEIRVMQGTKELTVYGTTCSDDTGYGSIEPFSYDPDGEDVVLEISKNDVKDLAFRAVGYNG